MPKRCSIAVYPTRRNVLEGGQYLAIGCYLRWGLTREKSSDSRCRIRPVKMAIAMVLYMDRRFRIDKVALEFSGFVYNECTESRLLYLAVFGRGNRNCLFHTDNDQGVHYKILSLTLG
jgi:hypothetical protein